MYIFLLLAISNFLINIVENLGKGEKKVGELGDVVLVYGWVKWGLENLWNWLKLEEHTSAASRVYKIINIVAILLTMAKYHYIINKNKYLTSIL